MIMNYGKWFYNQHKYRKNMNKGVEVFNDTKWVNINDRYKKLIDEHSALLSEQPFIVQGNYAGFDKLMDLMSRSNYTFEDIDDAFGDTYRMSLQNTMSRNLVNTQSVIFATSNLDSKNTISEKFSHYKIIEAPFYQLHFGHRDEFIRQKISEMHQKYGDHYVDISLMNSNEFVKILDFSIICTVNGYICNDCKIAIDDKGFKFKIGWPYSSDVNFIVYKLDHSKVFSIEIPAYMIKNQSVINYDLLGLSNIYEGMKCIVNIYDSRYIKTVATAPNFGLFDNTGLNIKNLQQWTVDMLNRQKTETVTVDIYGIKFLHEVPNIYPAVNYYDIIETRGVYDEKYEKIKTPEGYRVIATNTNNVNYLETCTPPICLDRNTKYSFDTVIKCLAMYDEMMKYNDDINRIGEGITYGTERDFSNKWKPLASKIYSALKIQYTIYQRGAIITSLIKPEDINLFYNLLEKFSKLVSANNIQDVQKFEFNELYGNNYKLSVIKITEPFRRDSLESFADMNKLSKNYFDNENSTRFNRPIAEDSFITLRWNRYDNCWIFDYPEIKRFHGIGNSFFINSKLNGDEMYKFFVLYSDTEAPDELNIEHFDEKTIFDFDMFCDEVDKHMGCIRYFDAENRLLKMSKMLYADYSDETCVQVLSKILKRKLDGDSLLKLYPSDINYEESNKTTDYLENYTNNTERGPFTLNFLFYTLSMLNDNEDRLQAYFYRQLTQNKFTNRYSDINIEDILSDERYPINYSQYSISPSRPSTTDSVLPTGIPYAFYGLPLLLDSSNENMYEPYRFVLNVYDPTVKFPMITENSIDNDYYTRYDDIESYGGDVISYSDDIRLCNLFTKYLCDVYESISNLQTNYQKSFDQSNSISSNINTINQHIIRIRDFIKTANFKEVNGLTGITDLANTVINNNPYINKLTEISDCISSINTINYNDLDINIIAFINQILLVKLRYVYDTTGFDNYIRKRTRMLYIHLKKINLPMNPYMYKKWINNIDMELLSQLDNALAENENYNLGDSGFKDIHDALRLYIDGAISNIDILDDEYKNLISNIRYHINPIISYCEAICNNVIFDIYTIDSVLFDMSQRYSSKPAFIVVKLPYDSHSEPPVGIKIMGTHYLIFQPIIDMEENQYKITSISNICEYAFFDGTQITDAEMYVISDAGIVMLTIQDVTLNFIRISSTADKINTFNQLINSGTTEVEFENGHESFEVVNGLIVNEKHADMNYEMLIGNHFAQLNHEIEYVLNPQTWLQGSIDKIYIDNQILNKMSTADFAHHGCANVYFKPVQVLHIEVDDGVIESINGKYFEGQTIYLKTKDNLTCFPVKITTVDHGINKGFIEAEVDSWNAKWFNITDKAKVTQYFTEAIECEILPDNISNFLDEFYDETYSVYNNPGYSLTDVVYDENFDNAYKLPGDPIYVVSNANFVYSRLNWMFDEIVPNRFVDEEHKTKRFIYVSSGFINNDQDILRINMVNHDFNLMSLVEKYPILRDEPNDHDIWQKELDEFKRLMNIANKNVTELERSKATIEEERSHATTLRERERLTAQIESLELKIDYNKKYIDRLTLYIKQQEKPTTWFNVRSYEATSVYIANGKADSYSPRFISNINDLVYVDDMEVLLYDWEHKQWLDPTTYTITKEIVDNIKLDERDDYATNSVLHSITIIPNNDFTYSKKLLVYFVYDKSDIFNSIEMNPTSCYVKFKPLLSLDTEKTNYDPYSDIKIRKHFDGYEKYKVSSDDIHIKRINRSGKYVNSPTFRVKDLIIEDTNGVHTYEDIDKFMVPNTFKFCDSERFVHYPSYITTISSEIDAFIPDTTVKLISISNNENSDYDGNISSVMFEGILSYDEEDNQVITITKSTLPNYEHGTYICTVFQSDEYDSVGGVITVRVITDTKYIYDKEWITVPEEYLYHRELPNEFKIVMKNPTTDSDTTVTLSNKYIASSDDTISITNDNDNPYEYYYDELNLIRYPISNTRINSNSQRLVIDTDINPTVGVIKTPYIGICRYSLNRIPQNGLIDMTGYLPTPLTRNRYEFWVNGRYISNPNDLIILSPTSIQLCNMKSLKNFECIELVDDINTDNDLFREGSLYIDINGNTYSNYRLAMLSNLRIRNQDIKYIFNANTHNKINDYTNNIVKDTNNLDIEDDILSFVTLDDNILDYNKLYNIPSINGISLFHPKLQGLGISEIPNKKIIELFDKVWKFEETTNPLFGMTHKEGSKVDDDTALKLHIKQLTDAHWNNINVDTTGMFLIYATGPVEEYFSLYISKTSDGVIDDINNTVKIIPFIMTGVYVLIDKKYQGMWLHSTFGNTKPIHIVNMTPTE